MNGPNQRDTPEESKSRATWCNAESTEHVGPGALGLPRDADDPDPYVCTLKAGHEGPHVAEDPDGHLCAAWPRR
jgi:hypothetical protein